MKDKEVMQQALDALTELVSSGYWADHPTETEAAMASIAALEAALAQSVQQTVGFSEFLDSRDFYELMQVYRHTSLDAAKEYEAVKSALRGAIAQPAQPAESCIWTEDDPTFTPDTYASACGELWSFIDGGPAENNVRFCQGCGKPVQQKEPSCSI